MAEREQIKSSWERNARAVELRPAVGRGTAITRVELTDGLRCEISDGPWQLTADMSPKNGGGDAGPNPGVLGRGALGSCLAIAYAQWAARRGVELRSLAIEIQADYDARGLYAIADDVPPSYGQVRYVVSIESDTPEAEVKAMLDEADAHCPYLDVFRRALDLRREVHLRAGGS